ncbi:glycosyltransferase [Maribellus sediminis]|uniref:glycosyltransferase n=1 Tax=Maribellus sediminis TaxID=2696285 RepID=UPI0014310F1E|nr:glycosyltransferase [Maribellus sediminis]
MSEAIVITPVKDSLTTLQQTVEAIIQADGDFEYIVFNDFSQTATKDYLNKAAAEHKFQVIHLEDITDTPSPNYKLVLQMAQEMALKKSCPLVIVESDVVVKKDTFTELFEIASKEKNPGVVGAITVDQSGAYNFPYTFEKIKGTEVLDTNHSLSFCCTLLTPDFLTDFSFKTLAENKDWFDVFISRKSKKMGYHNYLAKGVEVLHLPHSSRPWKNLKYKNPVLYYLKKIFLKRDRI